MPKILIHGNEARQALARGVKRLAAAVEPTLGPKGMNAMVDRPIGTPLITRDGVSIASEIELFDRFENMGAQVVREVSMQTNEVAGDGTTTSIVLANGIVQGGVELTSRGAKAVDLCHGIDLAVRAVLDALRSTAIPVEGPLLDSVANIAANDRKLGALVADAYRAVGAKGVITTDFAVGIDSHVDVVEGMSFDRGYISHHLVTDEEAMRADLVKPYIVLTDLKLTTPEQIATARGIAEEDGRPLMIVSEDCAPAVLTSILGRDAPGKFLVVHPPEYGHWRKSMMEDLAILTGGRVIVRDLGGKLEDITREDLGSADAVWSTQSDTTIVRGHGSPDAIAARRTQVQRLYDRAPPNIEQDKLRERLAKLCGGTAVIYAGGVTPVEQKRTIQLIEDSLSAVRAAMEEGVVVGGGMALARIASALDAPIAERRRRRGGRDEAGAVGAVAPARPHRAQRRARSERDPAQGRRARRQRGLQRRDRPVRRPARHRRHRPAAGDLGCAGERRLGRDADPDHRDPDRRPHRRGGSHRRRRARRRGRKARPQIAVSRIIHQKQRLDLCSIVIRSRPAPPGPPRQARGAIP